MKQFPNIECAGITICVFGTQAEYDEQLMFKATCEQELMREIQIAKIEMRAKYPSMADKSIFEDLSEAVARARVWKRFKNGDDRNRRFAPHPRPLPAGGGRKILVDA